MINRILLAVDDSPAALTATEVTLDLASRLGARVLAVNVVSDYLLGRLHARGMGMSGIEEVRERAAAAVLRHVAHVAARAAVDLETQVWKAMWRAMSWDSPARGTRTSL